MKRNQLVFALSILLVLIPGNPVRSSAQSNTATLSGTVTDPQGLGVKSAKITLVNKSTGAERTASTDDNGRYTFVSLPPGTYRMTVDGGSGEISRSSSSRESLASSCVSSAVTACSTELSKKVCTTEPMARRPICSHATAGS